MAKRLAFDPVLFITIILLTLVGLVMVPSASSALNIGRGVWFGTPLAKQILLAWVGCAAMYAAMSLRRYPELNRPQLAWGSLVLVCILLLWALFQPTVDGVNRFLRFGLFTFQPSEAAKLALVFFFAYYFSGKANHPGENRQALAVGLAVLGMSTVLVGLGQDLGTAWRLSAYDDGGWLDGCLGVVAGLEGLAGPGVEVADDTQQIGFDLLFGRRQFLGRHVLLALG